MHSYECERMNDEEEGSGENNEDCSENQSNEFN